jgi:hypothetical protein
MEIQALRIIATEADLNDLAAKLFPQKDNLRDVRINLVPQGVRVTGKYQTVIGIPFDTLWEVSISEGKIVARLAKLKAGALSLGLARGYVLDAIADAVGIVELCDETLLFDLDALLCEKGMPLRTNLTSVRCDDGHLIIESSQR